jgi:hypothetical protein
MIPDLPTEANVKPVLDMMMPSIAYTVGSPNTSRFERSYGFVWMDEIFTELRKSNTVTATFDQFFVAMSYRLVDDP